MISATAAGRAAAAFLTQAGCNLESGALRGGDEIDLDRLDPRKERLFD